MKPRVAFIATLLGALFAALLLFLCLWRLDNKYTRPGPQPIGGVWFLGEEFLNGQSVYYPTHDWLYYPDVLLAPEEFVSGAAPPPEQYVFIGQYTNYAAGRDSRAPHGQASYRLTAMLPETRQTYALLMPDVYCAYRLYVNGNLLLETGVPDSAGYRPVLGERYLSFEAQGETDILIAAASKGYLTGGLTHPPAFGTASAVSRVYTAGLLLQAAACAVAALLALTFLYIRLFAGYRPGTLFCLLCLCLLCL